MIILGTNSIKDTGFDVANSLRFNKPSGDYLSRSPSSAGSTRKFTFSTWLKGHDTAANGSTYFFMANINGSSNIDAIGITNTGIQISVNNANSGSLNSTALFRDLSAWYHFVIGVDTTQGTASNRVKVYINGVQITAWDTETYPAENYDFTGINSTESHNVSYADSEHDGYLCETVFIDGTQLAADSFGEFDDSGIWKPIKVSGLTFGTNGFYLEYKESGTSTNSSGMGADTSGNDHHFAVNNLTAVDQSIDTCTNNFATLNPLDKGFGTTVYTEGNLNATSSSGWNPSRGTIAVTKGKWYWEIVSGNSFQVGVCNDTIDFANNDNAQDLTGVTVFYNASGGIIRTNGSTVGGTTATVDANDMVGFALDMDNKKLSVYKNGSIIVTNTSLSTSITDVAMIFGTTDGGGDFKINFGSPMYAISSGNTDGNGFGNFEYAVPSGYFALCTKNLAENG